MAKKKDKKPAGRGDAVRSAVDQAFQATADQAETARGRAQDIVDELAQAAGRVREVLDELRPPTTDELKTLRQSIDSLEKRVAALEAEPKPAAARSTPARRKPAAKPKTT
jgi:polyhydroxyalkanoate synthesis regulator phasin